MKFFSVLCILFLCLLISCDDSIGDTDNSNSSSDLKSILPGTWDIKIDGYTDYDEEISVNGNSVYFLDESYSGSFSSKSFTGTRSYGSVVNKLVINMNSATSISGYKSLTYSGHETEKENFTGVKQISK